MRIIIKTLQFRQNPYHANLFTRRITLSNSKAGGKRDRAPDRMVRPRGACPKGICVSAKNNYCS
jgi:hypothetical protein